MNATPTDVTIIVRECGERTADWCADLLNELFPCSDVHRISAEPFQETLRRSLELGVAEDRKWTLCIDADVLALPALVEFVAAAETLDQDVFEAQALVYDKLLLSRRPAGNHLYRTELIPLAIPLIPADNALRPEAAMIQAMAVKGFGCHQARDLVGLHDFEQSLEDVFSKAFLHGHKHQHLLDFARPLWEALSVQDADFRVALLALTAALNQSGHPTISRSYVAADAHTALGTSAIAAKPPPVTVRRTSCARLLENCGATLAGDARAVALIARIQREIDEAVFPDRPCRRAWFDGVIQRLAAIARWYTLMRPAFPNPKRR